MSEVHGWVTSALPDLLEQMKSGGTPDTSRSAFYGGEIPFVSIEDMTACGKSLKSTKKKITDAGLKNSNCWLVPSHSILYSIYATIGMPRINLIPVTTNQAILALQNRAEKIDNEYLFYWLESIRPRVLNLASQTTQSNLNATTVKGFVVAHPAALHEQSKIAEILSTVDQAIEKTEALIAKQQRIKTGLMQDLLTRGIDEHGQLRTEQTHTFKDSPLGRIPVEWEVDALDKLTSDIVDCPHTTPNFLPSGIVVARTFNLKDGQFVGARSYVSEIEYASRVSRLEPKPGDVIFTREAPVGEALVVPPGMEICLGQRTMQIRCKLNRLLPEFFVEFVYSEETRIRFDQMVGGTTNPHLNVSDVRSLLLRVPCVDEQNRIVLRIGAVRNAIQQSLKQQEKLASLKAALMQDLLTGRKRVTDLLEPAAA